MREEEEEGTSSYSYSANNDDLEKDDTEEKVVPVDKTGQAIFIGVIIFISLYYIKKRYDNRHRQDFSRIKANMNWGTDIEMAGHYDYD